MKRKNAISDVLNALANDLRVFNRPARDIDKRFPENAAHICERGAVNLSGKQINGSRYCSSAS